MSRPRFIAGATCPACGATDRIVVERHESGLVRRCVECGDRQVLDVSATDPSDERTDNDRIIVRSPAGKQR